MLEIVAAVGKASLDILLDSSIYILFGFFIAGLLKAFLPKNLVTDHLGKGRFSSIIKASAIGVPIPLCSCGVVPAAAGLREQGANKGATASFLISTPETGVDSIAITYALLDPLMTVIRPLSSFITATLTGIFINLFDREKKTVNAFPVPTCGGSKCSCGPGEKREKTIFMKFKEGMGFAFGDLFDDIGPWFLAGIVIGGAITVFVSQQLIESYLGDGFFSMVVMLVLAIPLYVCATSSTPIAATLALKGLSPGAALVFLLAGPATNAASLTVVTKILGKRATLIYLSAIVICSLGMGMAVNYLYGLSGLDITKWVQGSGHEAHGMASIIFTVCLILLMAKSFILKIPAFQNMAHKDEGAGSKSGLETDGRLF